MSAEENKAIARRYVEEAWNKGNLAVLDQLIATNYVDHSPLPGVAPDFEGVKRAVTMHRAGFPDLHFTIEDMIAEGDKVATRWTVRGTHHKGEWVGIAPTGKQVMFRGITIGRVADGKIVEDWINLDMLGVMQQLSVVPQPGQAGR